MKLVSASLILFLLAACVSKKPESIVKEQEVERLIRTLSSDAMQGRATFTPGAEKAAAFIENEFSKIGLLPLSSEKGYRQQFLMSRIKPSATEVIIDGNPVKEENVLVITDKAGINWNSDPGIEIIHIKKGENLFSKYREITAMNKEVLVYADEQLKDSFKKLRDYINNGRVVDKPNKQAAVVFVTGVKEVNSFRVSFTNQIEQLPLFNVAGMISGKSKSKEYVIFSAHYDHLGIISPVDGDSIANGADDDASGVTAVISLANYYKKINNNERTLIFVAFTAEELGGFGSKYFSKRLKPEDVVAMFNIEMIGKESKFGKNAAFITGYEKSDFGQILQRNLEGTGFTFHPDPYINENLFYRSDNATLAALGVPAHTISTDKIDSDKYYHTVNDEFETLDVKNIYATIKAISLSSRSIVNGMDTPQRIPKLEQEE
ncbi:M20/M25/M40 family metallo-hydrolase [Rubrolithibacter danxiaensis]|uniref:M20/M25/M40 family metallo-hydrolase n=1 Tax=Rubrolithibacter danxiaensis TaxID=3390805 RepID=UPI003BF89E7E